MIFVSVTCSLNPECMLMILHLLYQLKTLLFSNKEWTLIWLKSSRGFLLTNQLVKKTKSMLIESHSKLSHIDNNFSVKDNNIPILRHGNRTSISGSSNRWISKVSHTCEKVITNKISAGLAGLKRIRPSIPFDTRMCMNNSLVMPNFNCYSTFWGNTGIGIADKIQKLQNRAVIILTFSNYEVRSNVLLDELGTQRLETYRLKQLSICVY